MGKRLLMGPVLVLAVIGLLWAEERLGGTRLPVGSLIGLVMVLLVWLGAAELGAMVRAKGATVSDFHLRLCALVGGAVMFVDPLSIDARAAGAIIPFSAAMVLFGSMVIFARAKSPAGVIAFTGASLLAYVYLGLMFGLGLEIQREHTAWVLLWVVLTAKACDTGAYFTGKAIGRHKLIPWLSPGKTWEGLAGGMVFCAIVSVVGLMLLEKFSGKPAPLGLAAGAAFGGVMALIGQAGDLMASFMKRDAGLKDSGHSIPGMGGVLDVIDSPLLVLPVACWWLRLAS